MSCKASDKAKGEAVTDPTDQSGDQELVLKEGITDVPPVRRQGEGWLSAVLREDNPGLGGEAGTDGKP